MAVSFDPAEMLAGDQSEWDALVAVLDARRADALHDDAAGWVSRDVYAHLARWIDHSTSDLEARLQGVVRPALPGTDDEINARWQDADRALGFDEARDRADAAFHRRLEMIRSVPDARWSDPALVAIARADGAEHYRAHRGYVAAAG